MIFEKQILNLYKSMMHKRCDDTETVFYFSNEDFKGLQKTPHSFKSSKNHTLKGYFYQYENPIPNRLVIFDHGFGGGHRAYMKEIELLCRHGYKVFSYDHTGCMESEGETPNGLAQSLCDLNDCITMLKSHDEYASYDISVMGHSWGAFSTLNITALHSDISHIVAMCGFVSVDKMIGTFFPGILKGYRKTIVEFERQCNPKFVEFNSLESLSNSNVKALLIYSEDDQMCKKLHYDILKNGLEDKKNIKFLLTQNKGHNPNYTENAVKYLQEFGKKRAKLARNKKTTKEEKSLFVSSFNWDKMTEQDETVWNEIFNHLDS